MRRLFRPILIGLFVVLAAPSAYAAGELDALPLPVASFMASPSALANETPSIGLAFRSLIEASADETLGMAPRPEDSIRSRETAVYLAWGSGVVSGGVAVETAIDTDGSHDCSYSGTWANLTTVTFSGTAPKQDIVQITGTYACLRTRVDTVLSGGTVNTFIISN